MRGQLSVEMLIVLALILGLVFIVYTQMTKVANGAASTVAGNADKIELGNKLCYSDGDCVSGSGTRGVCANISSDTGMGLCRAN